MTITIVPSLLEPCRELSKFDTNCVKNYYLDAIVSAGYEHHSESSAFVIVQRALQGTQASNSGSESTSRPEKLGLMRVKLENCIAERERVPALSTPLVITPAYVPTTSRSDLGPIGTPRPFLPTSNTA